MSARAVAAEHARNRARLAMRVRDEARQAWAAVDPARISETWIAQLQRLLLLITGGQHAAAVSADRYVAEVLALQGVSPATDGRVDASTFAGVASDGRSLESLLAQPAIAAKVALSGGASIGRAMAMGGALVQLIAHTQVTDAGRTADQVALVSRRAATGYVRMAVGKTCSRCLILAGRRYQWNRGFQRHPHCDCIHIPAAEDRADDLRTDPKKAFAAMDAAEQDRVFGKAGAQAIRDGADMNQVVNARRGMQEAAVFGRQALVTTEGATTRGVAGRRLGARESGQKIEGLRNLRARPPRLMPEQIYRDAVNREDAIRLLRRFGYIL